MLIRALICGKPATLILENDEQFQSLKNRLGDRFQFESIRLIDISPKEIDALALRIIENEEVKVKMSPVSEEERSASDSDDDSV